MTPALECSEAHWAILRQHLFAGSYRHEQAAFGFASMASGSAATLRLDDLHLVRSKEFIAQSGHYLELDPGTWQRVIQRAHRTSSCIVEIHSHVHPGPARFSSSDIAGLKDTARHIRWRLRNRPFCAVVFALDSFDGLVWDSADPIPHALAGILVAAHMHNATGITGAQYADAW